MYHLVTPRTLLAAISELTTVCERVVFVLAKKLQKISQCARSRLLRPLCFLTSSVLMMDEEGEDWLMLATGVEATGVEAT